VTPPPITARGSAALAGALPRGIRGLRGIGFILRVEIRRVRNTILGPEPIPLSPLITLRHCVRHSLACRRTDGPRSTPSSDSFLRSVNLPGRVRPRHALGAFIAADRTKPSTTMSNAPAARADGTGGAEGEHAPDHHAIGGERNPTLRNCAGSLSHRGVGRVAPARSVWLATKKTMGQQLFIRRRKTCS
jgi:hypothetical protein